ncbi:MAG: RDD family protein [Lautropia sp.]|nr:MAG: RDD family protein [Lautropia sp.]
MLGGPSCDHSLMPDHTSAPTSPAPTPALPASPWRRFMSCVYDGIVLFGVLFFFGYAFSALAQFHGESGLARTLFQLYLFCLLGAYFGWFWSNGRWSLPMKTIGVKVVRDDGTQGPVSLPRALWRYTVASIFFWGGLALVWTAGSAITAVLWALLWLLPFGWSLFDRRRRTLYDVLAGTVLVRHDAMADRRGQKPAPR